MVYENFVIETKCHILKSADSGCSDEEWPLNRDSGDSSIKLIRKSLPVALLRTCRLVNKEATAFFKPPMKELAKEPLRLLLDYPASIALTTPRSPLVACFPDRPHTWTYKTPPNPITKAFMARCRPFLSHVRKDFQPAEYSSVAIEITLVRPLPSGYTSSENESKPFDGLRFMSTKFALVLSVVYEDSILFGSPRGSWPSTPAFRTEALRTVAWEQHVQGLREKQTE
jgi:hypothetical protein